MRHGHGYRKLNRTHEHRKAMFANMAAALIEHEQIITSSACAYGLARTKISSLVVRRRIHRTASSPRPMTELPLASVTETSAVAE